MELYKNTVPFYRYWKRDSRCKRPGCNHTWLYHGGPEMECSIINCDCLEFEPTREQFFLMSTDDPERFLIHVNEGNGIDALYHYGICEGGKGEITLEYDDCHD